MKESNCGGVIGKGLKAGGNRPREDKKVKVAMKDDRKRREQND